MGAVNNLNTEIHSFLFHPNKEYNTCVLAHRQRALVKFKEGYMQFALWSVNHEKWFAELNISDEFGCELDDVTHFAINGVQQNSK